MGYNYYPFGLQFNSYSRVTAKQNDYLYNGKELQYELDLNWLDYGARMYMPEIGRWGVVDPLADSALSWNPYHYVRNNPLIFIDPSGMVEVYVYGEDAAEATEALNSEHKNIEIIKNASGKLSYSGTAKTRAEKAIAAAIDNPDVVVYLDTDTKSITISSSGPNSLQRAANRFEGLPKGTFEVPVPGGLYMGTEVSKTGKIIGKQGINMDAASKMEQGGLGSVRNCYHELLEGYYSALQGNKSQYAPSHSKANMDYFPTRHLIVSIDKHKMRVNVITDMKRGGLDPIKKVDIGPLKKIK